MAEKVSQLKQNHVFKKLEEFKLNNAENTKA
jgi:hypothetical protein